MVPVFLLTRAQNKLRPPFYFERGRPRNLTKILSCDLYILTIDFFLEVWYNKTIEEGHLTNQKGKYHEADWNNRPQKNQPDTVRFCCDEAGQRRNSA